MCVCGLCEQAKNIPDSRGINNQLTRKGQFKTLVENSGE